MKNKTELSEKVIKEILERDLKKISNKSFNDQIIRQIELQPRTKKAAIFDQQSIFLLFLCSSLSVSGILSHSNSVPETYHVIGLLVCIIPILLMFYNWLFLTVTHKSLK